MRPSPPWLCRFSRKLPVVLLLAFTTLACQRAPKDGAPAEGTPAEDSKQGAETAVSKAASEEPILHIPVGEFLAGSSPGQPGRHPGLEPRPHSLQLGPFRIDSQLFPGGDTPKLSSEPTEAQALCATRGGRLCTELEWERACKGPASTTYPGGEAPCDGAAGAACRSGFDTLAMTTLPEWTGSVFGKNSDHAGQAVLRGAAASVPSREKTCARRRPEPKGFAGAAFRCCYGAPNAARIPEPESGPPFAEVTLEQDELRALLETDARTKQLAQDATFFKEDAAATVLARGPGDTMGFTLTTRPVRWRPARGVSFLVLAGHAGKRTAFVLVYYDETQPRRLAGSFLMKNEPGPVALAYAPSITPRMHFSGCWGCPGETGKVLFRPEEDVVLLQP